MTLPGFYAQSSLQEAGYTYCCFAYRDAGSLMPVAVPQLYRADPGQCQLVCDPNGGCTLDCPWPGVSFGNPGPGKSAHLNCIKRCANKYGPGSAAYRSCIDKC